MLFFYQEIENVESKDPLINVLSALKKAKMRLRTISVKELKSIIKKEHSISAENSEDLLQLLENYPEEYCLYRHPYYWDAFVCYQYQF